MICLNLFYHLGLWLYRLIARLISPFNIKAALFTKGHNGLISKIKREICHDKPVVWFHCASLGEFEQGRPIIEAYSLAQPQHKIVVTFFSPSGYEVKKGDSIADWIFYFPLDTKRNARRFLDTVQPVKAIFIKYEFWYNYLVALKKRSVPTYIVSATFHASQPFFKWYGAFFRRMLRTFTFLFVQNQASATLLERIDFKNVVVAGDTRFDRVWAQAQLPCSLPVIEAFCQQNQDVELPQKICVAGSTWPRDEVLLCQALHEQERLKLILVPHVIDSAHIAAIMEQFAPFSPLQYTKLKGVEIVVDSSRVVVVDTMGLLSSLYRFGSIAYVGGGFEDGIHNILEAAVYGIPIVFGPNYAKFNEAVDLVKMGGAYSVRNGQELISHLNVWINDPHDHEKEGAKCLDYVKEHVGATRLIIKYIAE